MVPTGGKFSTMASKKLDGAAALLPLALVVVVAAADGGFTLTIALCDFLQSE